VKLNATETSEAPTPTDVSQYLGMRPGSSSMSYVQVQQSGSSNTVFPQYTSEECIHLPASSILVPDSDNDEEIQAAITASLKMENLM